MSLDRIITDPIISTENTAFNSPSQCRPPVENIFDQPSSTSEQTLPTERDHLVSPKKVKKPFYRARPLWLVPFALATSLTRGMTLASRVEVFTELSCNQLRDPYKHTSVLIDSSTFGLPSTYRPPSVQAQPSISLFFPPSPKMSRSKETKGDGVHEGDDPRVIPGNRCVSDPAVQAKAARLQTIMTTIMGALSALTTGWWGHFGERHGRTRVLGIASFGLFMTDLIFILVVTPNNPLAGHSHKLLVLAPVIEGLLGGWSALTSAQSAYITDCTSSGSRATIFARFSGVLFIGLALGPILGAWLIRNPIYFLRVGTSDHPLQSVNSVFWVSITCSFVNFLLVSFVIPESLSASRRAANRKGKSRAVETSEDNSNYGEGNVVAGIFKNLFSPLALFFPSDIPVVVRVAGEAQVRIRRRKDWGLTLLAIALALHMLASGLFQLKYLYAEHIYDWSAEQLSYYISFQGAIRACYLLLLLPFFLVTFKPIRSAIAATVLPPGKANGKPAPTIPQLLAEMRFDLVVLRCSMIVEFFSHAAVVLAPLPSDGHSSTWWSEFFFVGATSLACAGAGVLPAVQSFALSTLYGRALVEKEAGPHSRRLGDFDAISEPGKLLGALAVLQAAGSTILGPVLFGLVYSTTVASFPRAIFVVAAGLILLSIILTFFIRTPGRVAKRRKTTAVPAAIHITSKKGRRWCEEENRGRSRVSKDLRGGAASPLYGATNNTFGVTSHYNGFGQAGPSGSRL
ncbi:major facilitator superfamily domain-containing protein [Pisolithus albus]|nr:major facilitator superfamily domain-containing protein [Pisolithus albus]